MNDTIEARKALYVFLYAQRVEHPNLFYDRNDIGMVVPSEQLEAALLFGKDMGHLETYRKHYYRLSAQGMLFAEERGWV